MKRSIGRPGMWRRKMKDLKINYLNCEGKRILREYDTIMDFIEEMESDRIDIPMLDDQNVKAVFFENPLNEKIFDTINGLLIHCKNITR